MQISDQTLVTAGAFGGVASFATGTALGIRSAGNRYAAAHEQVRSYGRPEGLGPTNAAEAKAMSRAATGAGGGAAAITDMSKPFNLDAPGMRSAGAIKTGARLGALGGVAVLAGSILAAKLTRD